METNLILSKESSESEIKRYFNAVLELSKAQFRDCHKHNSRIVPSKNRADLLQSALSKNSIFC